MRRTALVTLVAAAAPRAALACPVCFGQNDSPMAWAANVAIIVMLIVTGGVLAGFGTFIFYLARRASMEVKDVQVAQVSDTQEGTAQC